MQVLKLDNPFSEGKIYFKESTDSTMNDARTLIPDNPPSGTVVLTSHQTAGRGRVKGRKWLDEKGKSLMFTLLLKESDIGFFKTLFPLYAGYSIHTLLEKDYGINSAVKWPNDVLVDGKKISGILCENTDNYILCGIGMNLNQEKFPGFEGKQPVSLLQLTGGKTEAADILIRLLKIITSGLNSFNWKGILEEKLYMKGENVILCEGLPGDGERIEGVISSLGEYGQLIIKEKKTGKLRNVYSGEIF